MTQNIDDLLSEKNESEESLKLDQKLEKIKIDELENKAKLLAGSLNISYISLQGFPIIPSALSFISIDKCRSLQVICFALLDDKVKIGVVNPSNSQIKRLVEDIESQGKSVEIFLISDFSLNYALDTYEKLPKLSPAKTGVEITEEDLKKYRQEDFTFDKIDSILASAGISEIMTAIIAISIQVDSSDIHIEAQESVVQFRMRIDGVLHVVASLDIEIWSRIISRIKLISGLKINIDKKPQDGRFTIHLSNEDVDVRVSTIPTNFGESVVMRLLRSSVSSLEFKDLGIRGKSFIDLEQQVKRPNGMIVTTGPTGSGKTTTLYSILRKLNSSENKIITLEDPIEYRLNGVNQSQIQKDKDYSFASGLKSILRQDPDIVMVGEIRDLETADVAINASLTGHLVISTIHTNSAAAALPRFLAMGVKPFLLSPSLNAIIGQRLVRKICPHCKEKISLDTNILSRILNILSSIPTNSGSKLDQEELNNLKFYRGKGCEKCHGLGYKGRLGIYEILTMSPEIEKVILENKVSEYVIQELAQKNGMVTMIQDGLLKAKDGITTIDEIFKVAD